MAVAFESGYTLPGSDLSLKHARMLHRGNRFTAKTVVASAELSGYEAEAADSAMTDDVWKPFANEIESPSDFSTGDWSLDGVTVGNDGQTLTEDATTGNHKIIYGNSISVSAIEYVTAVRVRVTGGRGAIRIYTTNEGDNPRAEFDLFNEAVDFEGDCVGGVTYLGNGEYIAKIVYTANAGTVSDLEVQMMDDGSFSYDGDTSQTIRVIAVSHHASVATWDLTGWDAQAGDAFCVAGHNIGNSGGAFAFAHDSNGDDTYTEIGSTTAGDNSPIMFIHEGVTSDRWRFTVSGAVLPSIGVMRVGKLLQWQRPFYGGFSPSVGNRQTVMRGNVSIGGKWLGRTKVRTSFGVKYEWQHLKTDWVRANLLGMNGVLQSLEDEPFFIAWRPGEEPDVDYSMTSGQDGWTNMGVVDMTTFSIQAEVHGYD